MLINMPIGWLIALNVFGWPVIHIVVAAIFTRLPATRFNPHSWLFRPRRWETNSRPYQRIFSVKSWKALLPDGAPWFRGFSKRNLAGRGDVYLARFVRETCRSESAHWVMLLGAGIFFLWNPLWADVVMVGYAIIANLPCILAQRYNRVRLMRVLARRTP